MDGVTVVLLLLGLWLLWDIRRTLGLRGRPALPGRPVATTDRGRFPGALPPNRFVVVRWPDGHQFYQGTQGAQARQVYEHLHPRPGEDVEFWELGARRGHKAG